MYYSWILRRLFRNAGSPPQRLCFKSAEARTLFNWISWILRGILASCTPVVLHFKSADYRYLSGAWRNKMFSQWPHSGLVESLLLWRLDSANCVTLVPWILCVPGVSHLLAFNFATQRCYKAFCPLHSSRSRCCHNWAQIWLDSDLCLPVMLLARVRMKGKVYRGERGWNKAAFVGGTV